MGAVETARLYKDRKQKMKRKEQVEQKRRDYYEKIRVKQKEKIDSEINKKIQQKVKKENNQIDKLLKDITRKEKGKEIKIKTITIGKLHKIVRDIFSFSVRLDSAYKTTGGIRSCKCCTCGTVKSTFGEIQDGHYISRTNKFLLYDRYNNHGQCSACNDKRIGNGRPIEYEGFILNTYGPERLEFLKQKNDLKYYKHSIQQLEDIIQESIDIIKKYLPMIEIDELPKVRQKYVKKIINNKPLY